MRDMWTALRLIFPPIPGDLEITGQQDRVISTEEQVTTGPIPELPSLPLPGNTKELIAIEIPLNSWAVSDKTEDMPTLWRHNPISKYWLKRNENLNLQNDVYQNR